MINNILPNKVKYLYFEKHEHLGPGETVTEDVNWKHSHRRTAFHDKLQNFWEPHALDSMRIQKDRPNELSLIFKF